MVNIHAHPTSPVTVPADPSCATVRYADQGGAGVVAAPHGADAGRDALRQSVAGTYPDPSTGAGGGCIDIAASDLDPRAVGSTGDLATFRYFASALDAVAWSTPSLQAPATMTLQNLRDIYACAITDWHQLPGRRLGSHPAVPADRSGYPTLVRRSGAGRRRSHRGFGPAVSRRGHGRPRVRRERGLEPPRRGGTDGDPALFGSTVGLRGDESHQPDARSPGRCSPGWAHDRGYLRLPGALERYRVVAQRRHGRRRPERVGCGDDGKPRRALLGGRLGIGCLRPHRRRTHPRRDEHRPAPGS